MREVIEERPEHDQAGARPAAPARPRPGPPNDFWAQGNHGQFIYVSPSRNVVLVRFGTEYNYDHWPELLAGLARRL
jgi:CubicO group peptidase (beta-lactamase class C family)